MKANAYRRNYTSTQPPCWIRARSRPVGMCSRRSSCHGWKYSMTFRATPRPVAAAPLRCAQAPENLEAWQLVILHQALAGPEHCQPDSPKGGHNDSDSSSARSEPAARSQKMLPRDHFPQRRARGFATRASAKRPARVAGSSPTSGWRTKSLPMTPPSIITVLVARRPH